MKEPTAARVAPRTFGPRITPTVPRARSGVHRAAEARLLSAARRGDREALGELLERASGPAYRFSRRFCRDPHDTEDLVQEVLISLMRSLAAFRGDSSLATWTYVVARRACGRLRKRQSRQDALERLPDRKLPRADASGAPERRFERGELARALEQAIAALPQNQREVLVLRDVEGLPAAEVGRVLGLGERAVKSRLHRARLALREPLSPFLAGHEGSSPGARCPDTARLLSRHIEGELTPAVCSRLEAHVSGCDSCLGACHELREILGACRDFRERQLPAELERAVRAAIRQVVADARRETRRKSVIKRPSRSPP